MKSVSEYVGMGIGYIESVRLVMTENYTVYTAIDNKSVKLTLPSNDVEFVLGNESIFRKELLEINNVPKKPDMNKIINRIFLIKNVMLQFDIIIENDQSLFGLANEGIRNG